MKKLKKLSINPEKLMKNDELINLRGGYGGTNACGGDGMYCYGPSWDTGTETGGYVCGCSSQSDCIDSMQDALVQTMIVITCH